MPRFAIRHGSPIPKKMAQRYGEYLTSTLPRRLGHSPTTDEIWQDARNNPNCPYRNYFTWDAKKAAIGYWRSQARTLANSIVEVTVINNERAIINSMFSVYTHPEDTARYVRTADVQNNPFMLKQVVDMARSELEYWEKKYRQYRALSGARKIVSKAIAKAR